MKKGIKITAVLLVAAVISFTGCLQIFGESAAKVMYALADKNNVKIYLQVEGDAPQGSSYQIGNTACEDITAKTVSEDDAGMRTLIMVDNSLSIPEQYRDFITELIDGIVDSHGENEYIRIATFADDIEYQSNFLNDYTALKNVAASIKYSDQETYLTDVLSGVLDELESDINSESEPFKGYTRILVISDGVDNKPLGITKEELNDKIKKLGIPIYTIGAEKADNNSELENMFALSRISNADSFVLNDSLSTEDVLSSMNKDHGMLLITAAIPEALKDGSRKNTLLKLGDSISLQFEVDMPFGDGIAAASEEAIETEATEQVPSEDYTIDIDDEKESTGFLSKISDFRKERPAVFWSILLGIGIVLGVIIYTVIYFIRKPKKSETSDEPRKEYTGATEVIRDDHDDHSTRSLFDKSQPTRTYRLILTDVNDPSKIFQCGFTNSAIIGRDGGVTDITIDYDKSISKRHCMISCRSGRFYITDLGSSNKTRLNDQPVTTETEIMSGNRITLGRSTLTINIQ
ncbi:MAG: FHA domain-containing protein [Lachnospiraceae bacterium]|nr:FHA domain-containing protein [Lachnospiraceae bacterium]